MRTLSLLTLLASVAVAQAPTLTHGPFRGHVDSNSLHVWARASAPGAYELQLTARVGGAVARGDATATAANDGTLHFAIDGLAPGSAYSLRIVQGEVVVHDDGDSLWTTGLPDDAAAATFAFGSCANERTHEEQPIWDRIVARAPHGLVLLGDTPYIDLGTTAARRARHRAFFAHPPVAKALRAIPTWATWDDHDYTANDEFGAVPGSETARDVFLEYHAHASYGDGARGIWTRCRQGPIEVFVLDARTCADTGDSPLAPGERTLLGATQIEWLQAGLRASTAPIKVLASGMVWNGAVRPGKKDHWGNWLAERDALFRWLGANDIGGVMLVSGDVHRSRVLVHPTTAAVGYDLVEFVTSPLAQNVIEANAVAAPEVVFDAGEAHSCLFLAATVAADGAAALRATFGAGDGREFHVRDLAASALQRADAAPAYRRAVAALRAAFGEDCERLPESEHGEAVLDPTPDAAAGAAWRSATATAAPALAAWQQALAHQRCRFRATSREPATTEYMHELFLPLRSLQRLGVARVLQAMADGDADAAVAGTRSLLGLARHLQQEPGGIAWSVAAGLETTSASLHEHVTAKLGAAAGERVRDLVRDHLAARPAIAGVVAAMRIETFRLYDGTIDRMLLDSADAPRTGRPLRSEVRREFLAQIEPFFALGEAVTDASLADTVEELRRRGADLAAAMEARKLKLRELAPNQAGGERTAADFGLLLANVLVPNLPGLLQAQADALQALRAVAK